MKTTMLFLIFSFSFSLNAASIYCSGKIKNSYINKAGDVIISGTWHTSWTRVCNTSDSDVVNCSLWASYVATAVKDNLDVIVSYNANNDETCSNLPAYNSTPQPIYIMIKNPNYS